MKKLLLCLTIMLSAYAAKATVFTFNIATTDSAYVAFYVSDNVVDTDNARIVTLGARPLPPQITVTNSDWSTFVTNAHIWDSTSTALHDSLDIHGVTRRINELAVLTTLGYLPAGSIPSNGSQPPVSDIWVKVQGGDFPTAWIAYSVNSTYIYRRFVQPTQNFPNY